MLYLGDWLVDPSTRRMNRGTEVIRLSPKAMAVLNALHEAGGQVVSRDALLERVWSDVIVGEEVLTHAIAELRKAFGDSRKQPRYIETVQKSGYRLLVGRSAPTVTADDLELHAAYLDGCELFFRGGPENVKQAVTCFSSILDSDPQHALAYAGLTKSLFFMDYYFGSRCENSLQLEEWGRQAVAHGAELPETHAALGLALGALGRREEGCASFATSLKLNPYLAEPYYLLGRVCFSLGQYRMSATMLERAAELRLGDFHSLIIAAKARRFLDDDARRRSNLLAAQHWLDQRLQSVPDDRRALCDRAFSLIELGDVAKGLEAATALIDRTDANNFYVACALARAGEKDTALDCLERVVEAGWYDNNWLQQDHDLDGLRDEPRFKRIARELGAV